MVKGEIKKPRNGGAQFCVKQVRIFNVGAVDELDLRFDSKHVNGIYAGNGTGKTTVLECISLLGHLPCFPVYDMHAGFTPDPAP